ncbi:acetate kinase [Bradyrhizobium sp. Tv2a-2]|uniref:acetate/propionate family kinase n=1 Tax=Bradyrhizobium sp. Tv2a-2 TaxID=113395 RepID=UPI0004677F5D|nr:acetate kinase [Bradyrhizobium sp. Tv2a-2]
MTESPMVLVINSGSSSLKFAVYAMERRHPLLSGLADRLGLEGATVSFKDESGKTVRDLKEPTHAYALDAVLEEFAARDWSGSLAAVGHRVVHGGERFSSSVLVTPDVLVELEAISPLAPLHNPPAVLGMRVALARLAVPHVAVLDTAFHQSIPPSAYLYAVPMALYRDYGVRRYGFHGASHRFVAGEAVEMLGLDRAGHGLVIAHLGNGASATAVLNGRSVDTTMGMTPLEGLVMGTRSGDIDPGALIYLARRTGWKWDDMDTLLNRRSGLLGLSELSNDCRELEAAASSGHAGAQAALEVFVHRLARHIGGLAMSLPRLDAVVFTGGIGENSARIRSMAVRRLKPLGLSLDEQANLRMVGGAAGIISEGNRPVAAVVSTNEEWMIARDTAELAGLTRSQ